MDKKYTPYILLALCVLAYVNIFSNGFAWDDEEFIQTRYETRTWEGTVKAFSTHDFGLYRPFRQVMYFLAYKAFGLNPWLYHLLSIVFHATATILLFYALSKLFDNRLAFFSSALFAVHPIHIERVTNATGSFDLIGLIFYAAAFFCYLLEKKAWRYASFAFFVFGLFSSEEIFTLPLLLLLYEFTFSKQYKRSIPYFILLAAFALFRIFFLDIGQRVSEYPGGSAFVTLYTMPKVILHYLWIMIFPIGLTPFRRIDFVYSPAMFLLYLGALLCLLYFTFRKNKAHVFFLGFFIITMLPFLNITPLQKIMAERYLFFPSIAIFGIAAYYILLIKNKKIAYSIFGVLIVVLAGITLYNNKFWKDDFTLMSRGVQLNPFDSKAFNNLGAYYFNKGEYEQSLLHIKRAITNDQKNYQAWLNLGTTYSAMGKYQESIAAYKKTLEIVPYNYEAYDKLGITYMKAGDYPKANQSFLSALYFKEDYYPAITHLGTLYGKQGDFETAARLFAAALGINPFSAEPYFNIGVIFVKLNQTEKALPYFRKAVELEPGNGEYRKQVEKYR